MTTEILMFRSVSCILLLAPLLTCLCSQPLCREMPAYYRWPVLRTILENTRRNPSSQQSDAQADYEHVVQLANNRDEIGDELDGAADIPDDTHGHQLRVPWHLRVPDSTLDDQELTQKQS
jgi:hypothetical protein